MTDEQKLVDILAGPTKPKGLPQESDPTEELETVDAPAHADASVGSLHVPSVSVVNLFRNSAAHPIVLDLCLLKKYGPEWYGWEPETLELRIPQDFHVSSVSDINMAKIQAIKTLHLVDTFWKQWEIFLWCTMSLNGIFPDFTVMQVPTVVQCAVSVDIAKQIRDDVPWSSEVNAYLRAVHEHDGIFLPQPPLEFVDIPTEDMHVNLEEVRVLWSAVASSGKMPAGETAVAEQLRRMLVVKQALEENRNTLRGQLPLVQHV